MKSLVLGGLLLSGCAVSSHAVQPSKLGVARSSAELLAVLAEPGPVTVETIASCDWEVERAGLINLEHPKAKEAGLKEGLEPIQIFFHVLRHPTQGTFLVDTGVEKALRDAPDTAAVRGIAASAMNTEKMKFLLPLGEWVARQTEPLMGVFITHLHLDHLTGMRDVPAATPIYAGPGETTGRAARNIVVQPNTDRALEGKGPLNEWQYQPDATGRFSGVLDLFGDGSVWAIWLPGHTPGTTVYVARTAKGPVMFAGDASHTRWGWDHDVEPGKFSDDLEQCGVSFKKLRALVAEHPEIDVRLGHQR